MSGQIKYLGFYDVANSTESRYCSPAAVAKMDYIAEVLSDICEEVLIISPNRSSLQRSFAGKVFKIKDGISLKLFSTYGRGKKINNFFCLIFIKFRFLIYLISKTSFGEKVVVYHSLEYGLGLLFVKWLKKIRLVLEVEEIYQDVRDIGWYRSYLELLMLRSADSYIFPTLSLNSRVNVKKRPYVVAHGSYLAEKSRTPRQKYTDGKIHVVYAGNLDPLKGGADAAIQAARYLPKSYHLHVIGFGSLKDTLRVRGMVEEISRDSLCSISFDGRLEGDEYKKYLQRCHIGLSTQDPTLKFNDSSFPSKILSYLSNDLIVVSSRVGVVESSEVKDSVVFYDDQTPESIAHAVCSIDTGQVVNGVQTLMKLDKKFRDQVRSFFVNS